MKCVKDNVVLIIGPQVEDPPHSHSYSRHENTENKEKKGLVNLGYSFGSRFLNRNETKGLPSFTESHRVSTSFKRL